MALKLVGMGGLVTEISFSEIANSPVYKKFMPDLKKAISGEFVPRFGADLELLIDHDPKRVSFGVMLADKTVSLNRLHELFRVRLLSHDKSGLQMETVTGKISACRLRNNHWKETIGINFSYLDENPRRLWNSPNIFWDAKQKKVLVGTYECANTLYITNHFQSHIR